MPGLKIAVVFSNYPKRCKYMQSHQDIFFPLIGGRATMNKDLNCDDVPGVHYDNEGGDNISWLNPYINEVTAIYWMGKHLDLIGNPDYVGLHHYRRFFVLEEYVKNIKPDTLILNYERMMLPMVDFLELCHGTGYMFTEIARQSLRLDRPELKQMFEEYINNKYVYTRNLFVAPARFLHELVPYIEALLPHVVLNINYDFYGTQGGRNMAFIMERLIGFFFYVQVRTGRYKVFNAQFRYVDPEELK